VAFSARTLRKRVRANPAKSLQMRLDLRTAIVKVRGLNGVLQARSSVEEHHLDTVGVGSSILPVPTTVSGTLKGSQAPRDGTRRAEPVAPHANVFGTPAAIPGGVLAAIPGGVSAAIPGGVSAAIPGGVSAAIPGGPSAAIEVFFTSPAGAGEVDARSAAGEGTPQRPISRPS
jgi:hypothetical protein